MPQMNLHEGELGTIVDGGEGFVGGGDAGACQCSEEGGNGAVDGWKWEGATYRSQGESPLVDLVRHVLKSCGMSCTVQKIAPGQRGLGTIGAGKWKVEG